jgi:hypothetical protein
VTPPRVDPVEVAKGFWQTASQDDHLSTLETIALCRVVLAAAELITNWSCDEPECGGQCREARKDILAAALEGR